VEAELDRVLGRRGELERTFLMLNTPTVEVELGGCGAKSEARESVCEG
jgi:hypothetical protein